MLELWEKHREFLTQVLSGAGIFLVLAYVVMRFGSEGSKERDELKRLTKRIADYQRGAAGKDAPGQGGVENLRRSLDTRAVELCVGVPEAPAGDTSLLTSFLKAKARVCEGLDRRATEEAVDVKTNLASVDFHERATDGAEDFAERWASLESFRRLMEALIAARFAEIKAVVCEPPVAAEIPGEPQWKLMHYGIRADVSGGYGDFVALFDEVNQAQKFVAVTVNALRSKPGGTGGELTGTVTGHGLRLVKSRAAEAKGEPAPARLRR
ncbi:MAG TPA: hypothetical protein PKX48_08355 [Planctomycetota bacterium]|jgi:hypothetical protein|nr:hypothetical protein [Planctomycetota bacterium]OQC20875.1 MAG: hypothetical protein BWX69_01503 [Planctomycetes bacterium ADurb.Bin069]NMD36293.1 hypothetical protein [Planctomycetota bacterium]HNR99603.1 hypothetical protein [Planctomycetota bacterium]HNU25654.1 hypothetical protein [Planctomycetota bacterium]